MLRKQAGFNLIELLIAMTMGLLVSAGALSVFLATSKSNSDMLKGMKLHQELRGAMSVIVRDLRRAGSWNYEAALTANPAITMAENPFNLKNTPDPITGELIYPSTGNLLVVGFPDCDPTDTTIPDCIYSCIEYQYDFPSAEAPSKSLVDGAFDGDDESFGFGFKDYSIKIKQGGNTCAAGMTNWERVTDETVVKITNFQIISHYPAASAGIQIRFYEVRIGAELVSDSTVKRNLVEFVRIRNDRLVNK